jgi:hypothetical protein
MTVLDEEGLLVVDSGLSSDTFNKIACARLQESEVNCRITEAADYFTNVWATFCVVGRTRLAALGPRESIA